MRRSDANREAAARRNLQAPETVVASGGNVALTNTSPVTAGQEGKVVTSSSASSSRPASATKATTSDAADRPTSSQSLPVPASSASTMFPQFTLERQQSNASISSAPFIKANINNTSSANISHELLGTLHSFYKDKQLTDMEIHIQGKTLKAHRVVLAAASDFFKAMFSLDMSEKTNGIVNLHDLDPSAVETLVQFAYTFELKPALTVDNVQPLLCAASILQFGKVLQLCSDFIAANLDPKHALSMLTIGEHFALEDLLAKVRNFVARNFHATVLNGAEDFVATPVDNEEEDENKRASSLLSDDLVQMSEDDLLAIYTDKELIVRNEAILVEVLLKWSQYDPREDDSDPDSNPRLEAARRVMMKTVRFAYLPPTMLYKLLRSEPLTMNNPELTPIIQDALICQLQPSYDDRGASSLIGEARVYELRQPRPCYSGAIFCVGGRQASTEPFRTAEVYDCTFNKWYPIPDLNARRRHVGVAVGAKGTKRGLFAVGGHDGQKHLNTVEMLPLQPGGKWRQVAPLRTLRRGLAVTSVQLSDGSLTLLFAIGGLDDQACFPVVEIYDADTDEWNFGPQMSQSRGGVAAATMDTRIFAVGGNDGTYSVDSGEMLDPIVSRWVSIPRMRHRRAGAGLSVLNGCLWVAGGFDENVPLNAVEFLDPRINAWQKGPTMLTARGGVGLATMGNHLYAVGGHDGTDYLASVECLDPRMYVTSISASASKTASSPPPSAAYSSNSSPQQQSTTSWQYVDSLTSGRAGAGLVHVPNVVALLDLPIVQNRNSASSATSRVSDNL